MYVSTYVHKNNHIFLIIVYLHAAINKCVSMTVYLCSYICMYVQTVAHRIERIEIIIEGKP